MNSRDVVNLLKTKHADDLVFTEQRVGAEVADGNHDARPKMDVWVVAQSWSRSAYIGYEIKLDRRDFVRDNKFHTYAAACDHLWVVAPKGVVYDLSELPEGVGLLEVASTGTRLRAVRKAARTKPDPVVLRNTLKCALFTLWRYGKDNSSKLEMWRRWAASKAELKDIGYRLRFRVAKEMEELRNRNELLELQHNEILSMLEAFGVKMNLVECEHYAQWLYGKKNQVREILGDVLLPLQGMERQRDMIRQNLVRLQGNLEQLGSILASAKRLSLENMKPPVPGKEAGGNHTEANES